MKALIIFIKNRVHCTVLILQVLQALWQV
jgi:hypothetical protein